jgi:hypothetical protein
MVRMILEIMYDMRYFAFILIIGIFGFANGFYLLAINDAGYENNDKWFVGDNFLLAMVYSFRMGIGDFDVSNFETENKTMLYIIWFINTVFILIILFNMLIAIMGDTFGRV